MPHNQSMQNPEWHDHDTDPIQMCTKQNVNMLGYKTSYNEKAPNQRIKELAADEAIQEADTLLLTYRIH